MGWFDDVDTGTVLGDTASGALTGSAGGPIGALVGGAGGLISGLLTKKKKPPTYNDPYKAQRDLAISDLMTGNYGQQAASVESGQTANLARDQVEDFKNNAKFAGNAGVQSALQNKILTNAERGSQQAYVHGAQIDSENRAKAGQLASEGSRLAQSQFELNQSYADRPSFGQQMLQSILSTGTGLGLSKLMAPSKTPDNPDTGVKPDSSSLTFPTRDMSAGTDIQMPQSEYVGGASDEMPDSGLPEIGGVANPMNQADDYDAQTGQVKRKISDYMSRNNYQPMQYDFDNSMPSVSPF